MRTSIGIAVCTHARNEPLRSLLDRLADCARTIADRADVGVVVVDDNRDQRARPVVVAAQERHGSAFALGVQYLTSGQGNISIARNIGCEAASEVADWIAMTDDDCLPVINWLGELLDAQERTGADVVTGPCVLRLPAGAPKWLSDEPFLEDAQLRYGDLSPMTTAATNNSMLRAASWRDRPDMRFRPELGVIGGEDMVFYRSANRRGLRMVFAANAVVDGIESADRLTFRYQFRSRFWLGNTEFVTNRALNDAGRLRLLARGVKASIIALTRPILRMVGLRSPQFRYCAASVARAGGLMAGSLGITMRHH